MPPASSTISRNRLLLPLIFGVAASFAFMQIDAAIHTPSLAASLQIEAGLFALASLAGCASLPAAPFRAALVGVGGVFLGILLDVIIHPTIAGGYERNLFPLEAAFHSLVAVPCFLLTAGAWKVAHVLLRHTKGDA